MGSTFIVLFFALFLWLVILTYLLYRSTDHYRRLVDTTGRYDLRGILDKIMEGIEEDRKDIVSLQENLKDLSEEVVSHIQKVGLIRFNPFSDTGGDQSFILAILDGNNTGVVITSLHSRGMTRWYAKNVKEGKGFDHELSKEEEECIKKATILKLKSQSRTKRDK